MSEFLSVGATRMLRAAEGATVRRHSAIRCVAASPNTLPIKFFVEVNKLLNNFNRGDYGCTNKNI